MEEYIDRALALFFLIILIMSGLVLFWVFSEDPDSPNPSDPTIPDEPPAYIELTENSTGDNLPLSVPNMLPGESVSSYYCIAVTHDEAQTVRFCVNLDGTKKLSEVLRIRVEQLVPDKNDKFLYDGLLKNCTAVDVNVSTDAKTSTEIFYRITVYINGEETGNEYQGESVSTDFSWKIL